ncbi:MAG: acetylxylan esterase [Clostridia bacterium]|nr:acetylxylan esterase [Clostridia bacterium]
MLQVRSNGEVVDVPYVHYKLEGDDGKSSEGYVMKRCDGWFIISTSLARDGFVHLVAKACDENKNVLNRVEIFEGGAGADIDKIRRCAEEPEDYFEFWQWLKDKVDAIEPEILFEEEFDPGNESFRAFDLRVKVDEESFLSCVYTYPKDAKPGTLGAYFWLPGYGVNGAEPMCLNDKLTISVGTHSIYNRQPPEYYANLQRGELQGYGFDETENEDPKTTYWAKVFIRDLLAVRYFKDHPLLNKKKYTFSGGSQGSMRACNLSAHSGIATECLLNIPWMCDLFAAETDGRIRGWFPKSQNGLRYFDTSIAAAHVTCPVDVVAGLGDYTCPPSGVYAMYRQIKSPKKIRFIQNKAHNTIIAPERDIYTIEGDTLTMTDENPTVNYTQTEEDERVYFYGTTLKSPIDYTVDEEIVFKIRPKSKKRYIDVPYVQYTLAGEDGQKSEGFAEKSEDGWYYITTSLKKDGFVHLVAKACDADKAVIERIQPFEGGAGADIDKIERATEEPEDYLEFWQWLKDKVDAIKPEVLLDEEMESESPTHRTFDFRLRVDDDTYVSGIYTYPLNAEPGSLGLYVYYPGYGVSGGTPMYFENKLTVFVNAHPVPNRQPAEFYQKFREDNRLIGYGWNDEENKDPKTTYWAKMLIRDMLAVKYFKDHPLLSKEKIIIAGGSQGAMRACNVTAHTGIATSCSLTIPWLCDLAAVEKYGRLTGWRPVLQDGLRYFDTSIASAHLTCPVDITAGLGDYVCPPSSVYAMYKQIKAPKKLQFIQNKSHGSFIPERHTYLVE